MGLYYTLVWFFYEACITSSTKGARNIQEGCETAEEEQQQIQMPLQAPCQHLIWYWLRKPCSITTDIKRKLREEGGMELFAWVWS